MADTADYGDSDLGRIRGELGKKSSFIRAAQELQRYIASGRYHCLDKPLKRDDGVWKLVERASTLLKTRYTGDNYWRNGQDLFQACRGVVVDSALAEQLEGYLLSCKEALGEDTGAEDQASNGTGRRSGRNGFLFEGQLSSEEEASQASQGTGLQEALMAQMLMARAGGEGPEAEGAAAEASQRLQEMLEQHSEEGLNDVIQQVLEASAEEAQQQPSGPPPAAKKVVASLPKEEVTEERLKELGGKDVECSVCRENIVVGDTVQRMPCSHVFHPPCLAPWLNQHNSCPLCRHELPTDDWRYETKKEREREAAEEESGRNNAISHSEFLYV